MTDGLWKSNQASLNGYYGFLGFGLAVLITVLLVNRKVKLSQLKRNIIGLIFCLFFSLWAWAYAITQANKEYPVSEEEIEKNKYAQTDRNLEWALYTLAIPLLVVSPFLLWVLKSFGSITWTFTEIMYTGVISLILGYVFLGALWWINYSVKEANAFPLSGYGLNTKKAINFYKNNNLGLWIGGGLTLFFGLVFFGLGLGKNKPNVKNFGIFLTGIGIILLLFTFSSYCISESSANNTYTLYLIITSFIIFACLIIPLIPFAFNLLNNQTAGLIGIISSCLALIFSIINLTASSTQSVNNSEDFGNYTNEGKKISEYTDKSYDLLNFTMSYNYFILGLASFSLLVYSILNYINNNQKDQIIKLISYRIKKYDYSSYLVAGILIFVGFVIPVTTILLSILNTQGKDDLKLDKPGGYLSLGIFGLLAILTIYDVSTKIRPQNDEYKSSGLLKFYHFLFIASLFLIPVISLIIFLAKNPKFFNKIQDTDNDIYFFGDTNSKNSVPLVPNGESQFSVASNFTYYANGIYFSGGRTNLDLESTRGVRYVSNQGSYYNLKYLYNGNEDFKEIDRGNGLNIFSLETNDIAYGKKEGEKDAFLVAVGENVGLTDSDNSTIFYNESAGTSITDLASVDTLNNWKKADSNPFEFTGNGVTAGSISGKNRWVAVGQNTVDYADTVTIKYSDDGKNWKNSTGVSFTEYGNKVVFGISGLKTDDTFIAVGRGGHNILRSTDGIDWTTTSGASLFSLEATDVAYGLSTNGTSGIWVAVGRDDTYPIRYSNNDGQTWVNADNTTYSFAKPDDVNSVTYNLKDGYFYAVGKEIKGKDNTPIYRSKDGNNWSKFSNDLLEVTSIASNLTNSLSNTQFDKVFYPPKDSQVYFVDKIPSRPLNSFIIFSYILTFILMVCMFMLTKKVQVNNT